VLNGLFQFGKQRSGGAHCESCKAGWRKVVANGRLRKFKCRF
jgi:hypothetical protein